MNNMIPPQNLAAQKQLIEQVKIFYRDMSDIKLTQLTDIYDSQVLFKDPVHEIRGIDNLHSYTESLMQNVTTLRFEFLDQLVGNESAYLKWNMHFTHPKLSNKPLTVRGMSQLQFNDKVYYHEDTYDLGEMLYEHLPILGMGTRFVKKRLKDF